MNLYQLHRKPELLLGYSKMVKRPDIAYTMLETDSKRTDLLPYIATSAEYSYWYARDVIKGPFPLGEPAIASSAQYSYYYAVYIIEGPFPLGESAIYADPEYANQYKRFLASRGKDENI